MTRHMTCFHRYGDDLDVSANIAAVADYLEDCARAQAAEPPSPLPDHSLRHLVCAVHGRPDLTGSVRLAQSQSDCAQEVEAGAGSGALKCYVMLAALHALSQTHRVQVFRYGMVRSASQQQPCCSACRWTSACTCCRRGGWRPAMPPS